MQSALYPIIILAVALFYGVMGYRRGFSRIINSAIGFGFGVIGARIFTVPMTDWLSDLFPSFINYPYKEFSLSVISASIVYLFFYGLFKLLTLVIKGAMRLLPVGILNRMAGALFGLLNGLMLLSVAYNLILAFSPMNVLHTYSLANDGNMTSGVLLIEPALTGCRDVDYLNHLIQIEEAKKISYNLRGDKNVIDIWKSDFCSQR